MTGFTGAAMGCAWGGFRMPRSYVEGLLLVSVGVCGYATQLASTSALAYAKAAPTTAMSYLTLVWSLPAGWILFHEVPTRESMAGAVLICSCTLLLGLFEVTRTRQ